MLRRQLAESTAILGDHLALYQIHSATPDSGVLADALVLDELARLRNRGLRVGVTVSGVHQGRLVAEATAVRRDGVPLFTSIQATWNVLERSCEPQLRDAHDAGFVVLVKEALANGRLVRGEEGTRGPLADLSRERGVAPDTLALAAVLAQPWADVVLSGASTVDQLVSNVRALDVTMTADDLERLAAMRVPGELYWQERARLPWN
jgi:aryl-alcohol dehydrogenase-like predicted oxidoreductase